MRYIIANKAKSVEYGISPAGHKTKDRKILLNEKEVMTFVGGDAFEDKVAAVDGTVYSAADVKQIIKREGWK